MDYRKESDTMGTVLIPQKAYFGPQTQRAAHNFPISGITFPVSFIYAITLIKKCAAKTNQSLGLIDPKFVTAISRASEEILEGKFDHEFIIDVFQTGSGTSTNMNVNEVIATRANEILEGTKHTKVPVHPNDHVNLGQSSNDVIPSAIHVAAFQNLDRNLIPALMHLHQLFVSKASEFIDIVKLGRTHLQDAVPITLGQEFSGYARQIELGLLRIESVLPRLAELALGGTAVGTGLNTHPEFAGKTIALIAAHTGLPFIEANNHFSSQASMDQAVELSGVLKSIAVGLIKIANDIRLFASGPRCGYGEIKIPSLQPGSSIMPGKVNPIIPEAVIQAAFQVIGNDMAITMGGQSGFFELNTALPLIAHNLLQSIQLMGNSAYAFADKCIAGIVANSQKCKDNVEKSLALATHLVPHIGYDQAALIAKKAESNEKTIRQVAKEENVLSKQMIDKILTY